VGVWGSIPPPTSTPIWAWCRGSQPDAVATAAGGHHHAPGWCLRRSWCSWLCALAPVPRSTGRFTRNWPLWHRLCHQDCPGSGSFWPLVVIGTIPRDMKGPPQVHPRSVRGRRKLARTGQLEAGLSAAGRCILQSIRRPGRRGLLPGVSVKRHPDLSRVLATARQSRGQTLGPPVLFREPGGLFSEDGGAIEIQEQAVR
jgi:hypothetical protein